MNDEYDLGRFVRAQEPVYDEAIRILRRGTMCTSYMEFIFPRLASGEGGGAPYAITSLDEASAFLASPVLGGRYRECVRILQRISSLDCRSVFGIRNSKKLHASLTLFCEASAGEFLLETMFDVWFEGLLDEGTMIEIRRMQ